VTCGGARPDRSGENRDYRRVFTLGPGRAVSIWLLSGLAADLRQMTYVSLELT
jgi:hypothetical protein